MKITFTKLQFMHGECSDKECPICDRNAPLHRIDSWVEKRFTVIQSGCKGQKPSPWWTIAETDEQGYQKARGDLRRKGFYDK